jgi:hypothetical protein
MRPLSSPVRDHRVLGRVEVAVGLVFIIIATGLNPVEAVIGVAVIAPVIAFVLYLVTFRPAARRAVRDPPPAPTSRREDPGAFVRRIRGPVAAQVVAFLLLTATARAPGLLGGIAVGVGVALLWTARWLEHWENEHDVGLLREPRLRARTGDGGGRGYYIAGRR